MVDSHTVTVSWGDGTSSTANLVPGQLMHYTFDTHTYAEPGSYTIAATVAEMMASRKRATTLLVDDPTPGITSLMPSQECDL